MTDPNGVPTSVGSEALDRLPDGWEILTHWAKPGMSGWYVAHKDGRVVRLRVQPIADDRTTDELAALLDAEPCIMENYVLPRVYRDVMGGA